MDDYDKFYNTIDWRLDNVYQEILMVDIYKYMPLLFNENPQVLKEYEKFISSKYYEQLYRNWFCI